MMFTSQRWRFATVVLITLAALAAASCSVEESLRPPRCTGGSGLISAQSVPTAQWLPCFNTLPDGWSYSTVRIDQGGTRVRLDSDRAGDNAAEMGFYESCDLGEAVSVPSSLDQAIQFDSIERLEGGYKAETFYLFEGGCVRWRFDFDSDAAASESIALRDSVQLLSRNDVNDDLRESFIDEDL
ncbi:MAG: hypothetical protein ACR2PK_06560 [Acidimicrobiales bacterium]